MAYYDDPTLQNAQMEAQTAGSTAVAYQSAASQLPAKLKEAVMGKLDYNKDLIEQKNKAQAEYFATPSAAREQYQDIWNPFEREKLVAGERAQAYQPYANLTDILGARMGSIADIINAGTGAFNSDVMAKQGAYQLAQQKYNDLLQMAQLKQQQANIEEAARNANTQQEFENQLALMKLQSDSSGSSGGGVSGIGDILSLATLLGGNYNQQTEQKPPQPTGIDFARNKPNLLKGEAWLSPGGQWAFDMETMQWWPVGD
jgi:hypothetical protein